MGVAYGLVLALFATPPAHTQLPGTHFVVIRPGTFVMGSPPDEPGHFEDETQHRVTLTHAFEICDHLVTQAEWQAVMHWNASHFPNRPEHPVESVSWFDCVDYCNRRSASEHRDSVYTITDRSYQGDHLVSASVTWNDDANGYRLPTEAEFEYACRAGSTTAYYNGPVTTPEPGRCSRDSGLAAIAWYCQNSGRETHPVATKPPNAWRLYDMSGNVQEWCWDGGADLTADVATDPRGPVASGLRIWRGGGWDYDPRHCRSADRGRDGPEGWFRDVGLRVVRPASAVH